MSTWLDEIRMEIENMDPASIIEPPAEVNREHDHIVCEAEDSLRKLYTLTMQLEKEANMMLVNARFSGNIANMLEAAENAQRLMRKVDALREIFWISLKDSYDLWDKPTVGVRKGWKVVWNNSDNISSIGDILGQLGFGK